MNNSYLANFFEKKSIVSFWTLVSVGTEKESLMKELKASRDREKELLNSKEAFKQLSEMMNDLKGEKEVKRSAFCERFLWFQITTGRYAIESLMYSDDSHFSQFLDNKSIVFFWT